jgi:hypothetical protein
MKTIKWIAENLPINCLQWDKLIHHKNFSAGSNGYLYFIGECVVNYKPNIDYQHLQKIITSLKQRFYFDLSNKIIKLYKIETLTTVQINI